MRALALVAPFAFCVGVHGTAGAQSAPAAQLLFDEGRQAMARGDLATACVKFADSQRLDPAPGTVLNLAICHEKAGRTATAWVLYRDAAVAYERLNRGEWVEHARAKASALQAALPRLTIRVDDSAVAGLVVKRDGAPLVASELGVGIPVDPGEHQIDAEAPGHVPFHARLSVVPGASALVTVPALERVGAPPTPAVAPPETPSAGTAPPSGQRTLGFVTAGVGAVGLATGSVLGLMALSQHRAALGDCPSQGGCSSREGVSANERALDFATGSTVAFVVGGVCAAAGAALYFTAPSSSSGVRVTPQQIALVRTW